MRDPIEDATHYSLGIIADLVLDPSETNPLFQTLHLTEGSAAGKSESDRISALNHLLAAVEAHSRGRSVQAATEAEKAINAGVVHPAVYFLLGFLSHKNDEQKSLQALRRSAADSRLAMASELLIGETLEEQKNYPKPLMHILEPCISRCYHPAR